MENKRTLPILAIGCQALRQKCKPVEDTEENRAFILVLSTTAAAIKTAAGLAANQLGMLLNVFITVINGEHKVVINPIIKKQRGSQKSEESCLSIPGIYRTINRPELINVEYQDENFKKQTRRLSGFESCVFIHEFEHLQGKLFVDLLSETERTEISDQIDVIEQGKILVHYDMSFKSGEILTPQPKPQPIAVTTDSFSNTPYIYKMRD